MPDIAMCSGEGCEMRNRCYRYIADPNPLWQSYFSAPPCTNGKCEEFWNATKEQHGEINEKQDGDLGASM